MAGANGKKKGREWILGKMGKVIFGQVIVVRITNFDGFGRTSVELINFFRT